MVIVNWQRPADTSACLASVYACDLPGLQVLLVDNGSQDDSIAQITRRFPQVEVLPLPENLGFAGGYNAGIRHALNGTCSHVFLLNNDTVLDPQAISCLLEAPWDVSVPKIYYHNSPTTIWAAGAHWRQFPPSVKMTGYGQPDAPAYNQPGPLEYATGCALMFRRRALEASGGFDPLFTSYMEDYDLCYRLRKAGFSLGYVPQARLWHKVSQTLGEYSLPRWRLQGRNTVLFYRKDRRFPPAWLWSFLCWVFARESVLGRPRVALTFLQGALEGLKTLPELENTRGVR